MIRFLPFSIVLVMAVSAPAQQAFTLRQAIDFGRANSPAMAIAANDQRKADAMAQEAVAGYLPQINGSGQLDDNLKRQTTILPAGTFGPEPVAVQFGTQFITTLNVQAEQTLIDVAQLNGIQANKPNTAMAAIKLKQAEEQVTYDVAKAYAQAQTYREQVKLLEENAKQYEELVPILTLRLEKGVAQQLELDRVEVTQRNIRSQHTVAQANYAVALAQLKRAMGMPMGQDLSIADEVRSAADMRQPGASEFELNKLLGYKLNQQSELLYGIDLKRKRNAFLPTLSAYGRYGAMAQGNELGESYENWFDYAAIGLKLNVPLFSGLRRVSQIKQSEIALENLREQQRNANLGFELDYRSADTRLLASTSTVANDEDNLRLAERVFNNTNLQYQQGTATLSDLLNADYQLKEARNNWITSLLNRSVAVLDLERAKGTLLDYVNSL
ncbi:MAG TPA: TolC family protein [Flavobacteriales bacterium]|nr:TolC family protein [Flavobacteriales bacterium]